MNKYNIYFEDSPFDPMQCLAKNKTEARAMGNLYIRQWQLQCKILKIEEVAE